MKSYKVDYGFRKMTYRLNMVGHPITSVVGLVVSKEIDRFLVSSVNGLKDYGDLIKLATLKSKLLRTMCDS